MDYPIYLDYTATTPCDQRVLDAMIPYFLTDFGNPNSLHIYGQHALDGLSNARSQVAKLINADFDEVVFTSGSTESNNTAILRTVQKLKCKFLTLKTEHKSVLDCANCLKQRGFETELLDVKHDGLLDLDYLKDRLTENVGLVSICFVNNETGVIQDIKKITEICHSKNVLVHVDATQAFGKISFDIKDLDVDFLSASGHKIFGPKGIGILFCKKKSQKLLRVPKANSAVEFGIRSGTVPVALCVGIGKASEIASQEIEQNLEKISKLREQLISGIFCELEEVYINGSQKSFYPGIVNMSLRGCEGEALMMEAKRIVVSSGSACTSNKLTISHVLDAMNIPADIAQSSLRITIGKLTTSEDINIAVEDLTKAVKKLRAISPVWDMIKAGLDLDQLFERKRHNEI